MDEKNDVVVSTTSSSCSLMIHDTHILGTVAFPKSVNVDLPNVSRRKMCTISRSDEVGGNFFRGAFNRSDLELNQSENDSTNSGNYLTKWKQKHSNGLQTLHRNMEYANKPDHYGVANQASDVNELQQQQQRAFENHVDTTSRQRINSDSNSSHFDQVDSEDVSFVKDENAAMEDSGSEPVTCSVCGDTVAGFHCGAYVCEACKKFFVRCLKQDAGMRFTCAHNKCCEITKETRTQCPSCRFQKCLRLGMYRPGGPNVSSEIGHIPCKVCGAPSSGFHFGAITCEGCKGFFRRTVKERDSLKYQCSRNSSCVITWKTRNICKMCRYRQCLKAGMKPDKSRIGRQPNSVKHATMLELNQIKSAKGLNITPFPVREFKSEPEDISECATSSTNTAAHSDSDPVDAAMTTTTATPSSEAVSRRSSIRDDGNDDFLELQPVAKSTRMKMESPDEMIHDDRPRCGSFGDDFKELYLYESNVEKYSMPGPLPPEMYVTSRAQQRPSVSAVEFVGLNPHFPVVELQSGKSLGLPTISDEEAFAEKFRPIDVGPVTATYNDVQPLSPVIRPISPVEKPSSPLPDFDAVIAIIQRAYKDLANILCRSDAEAVTATSSLRTIWDSMMTQFAHCAQATLRFAKKVPGFRKFPISEQIHMVQSSMFPIVVTILSLIYDMENQRFCYFMYSPEEMCHILKKFEPFQLLLPALHHMGQIVQELALDETEITFLCALHLMDSGNKLVYKELLLDALEEYIKRKFGQVCDRNGQILMCLRYMVDTNHIHQQAVGALLSQSQKYANLEVPQLFKESFIAMDD